VVFLYVGKVYPGKVISVNGENVHTFRHGEILKSWKWPEQPDILEYECNDILGSMNPSKFVPKREFYSIRKM
jgi:hypothetical protein